MNTYEKKRRPAQPGSSVKKKTVRRKKTQRARTSEINVVYTQPMPFQKKRFFLRLATVLAVVLALSLGMAIFFKVEQVVVSGGEKYTAWDIKEASGIQEGENLLTIRDAVVSGKVIEELPYVEEVRVGIKLPDTVNIEIKEIDVVYSVAAQDNSWWLMAANGKIVDTVSGSGAKEYTQILGVKLDAPVVGQMAKAAEPVPETTENTEDTQPDVSEDSLPELTAPAPIPEQQKLDTVVTILQYLEDNGILGQMASVDVSEYHAIELWYADRFQINLGEAYQLDYKISTMKATIDNPELGEHSSGVLDVSFTTWPDKVGYTPFP